MVNNAFQAKVLDSITTGSHHAIYVLAEGPTGAFQLGYVGMGEYAGSTLSEDMDQCLRALLANGDVVRGERIETRVADLLKRTPDGLYHLEIDIVGHRVCVPASASD